MKKIMFLMILSLFWGCEQETDTKNTGGDFFKLNENTIFADSHGTLVDAKIFSDRVELEYSGEAPRFQPGQVVICQKNNGFLRRIKKTSIMGKNQDGMSTITLYTEKTSLGDGFESLKINPKKASLMFFSGMKKTFIDTSFSAQYDTTFALEFEIRDPGGDLALKIKIPETRLTITGDVIFGIDLKNFTCNQLVSGLDIQASLEMKNIEIILTKQYSFEFSTPMIPDIPLAAIPIGPIILNPNLSFKAGALGSLNLSAGNTLKFDAKISSYSSSKIVYEKGQWRNESKAPTLTIHPINFKGGEINLTSNATVRVFLEPAISLLVFNAIGPEIWLQPYLESDINFNYSNQIINYDMSSGLIAGARLKTRISDFIKLPDFNMDLYEKNILLASGTFPELAAPLLQSPQNNVTLTSGIASFDWSDIAGATNYRLQIATGNTFSNPIKDTILINSYCNNVTLPSSGTHFWRVRSEKADGKHSNWSSAWVFDIGNIPVTPVLVSPSNGTTVNNPVTFSWQASSGATHYNMEVSQYSNFSSTIINPTGITGTSYSFSFSQTGLLYFRVRASNQYGLSNWSETRSFIISTGTAPNAPAITLPQNNDQNVALPMQIQWTSSGSGVTYRLQIATNSSFSSIVKDQSALTGTSYTAEGLSNNTNYYLRVNATNANGTSPWSAVITCKTANNLNPPGTPTLSSPTNNATGVNTPVTLAWNSVNGTTDYIIHVSTSSGFSNLVFHDSTTGTSRSVSGLNPNTKYYWRVRTKNTAGYSNWSSIWNFTTKANTQTMILYPTKDASVRQSQPNGNYGSDYLFLGGDQYNSGCIPEDDIFMQFDIASVPTSITKAMLIITDYSAYNLSTFSAHYSVGSWDENIITWNNKPGRGDLINNCSTYDPIRIDITQAVRNWRNGSRINNGLIIRLSYLPDCDVGTSRYYPREAGNTLSPRLEIEY